jgi:hypothetical protein
VHRTTPSTLAPRPTGFIQRWWISCVLLGDFFIPVESEGDEGAVDSPSGGQYIVGGG